MYKLFVLDRNNYSEPYHHHQVMLVAQIPLTLSQHPTLPSLLIGPLDGIQCPHTADECKSLLVS